MTIEERKEAINYFRNKFECEVYGAKYNKLAIEALEQAPTPKDCDIGEIRNEPIGNTDKLESKP